MAKPKVAAGSTVTVDIANINRTSDVSFADYVYTLLVHDPEGLADIVEPQTIAEITNAIEEAGPLFVSTTETAIAKTISTKVEAAIRALTNDAPLTGYSGRGFDKEVFAKKVSPKVGRVRLSPAEKAEKLVESATSEQLEALAALLREKGIEL